MKTMFIIDTYPSTPRQVRVLNECIDAIKDAGMSTLIVSHLPIDPDTSAKVDYVIYDRDNSFLPSKYTPFFFFNTDTFNIKIFNAGHSLPICRNMKNALVFAKGLGYQQFVFTECDVILHPNDLQKLKDYLSEMTREDKKMVYFKPEHYRGTDGSYVYETLLFAGDVDFFLNKFVPPTTEQEWLDTPMGYTLEQSFFEQFGDQEEKYVIIHDHSSNIFLDSKVNVYRYGLFNCEVIYNEQHPDQPLLIIMNFLVGDETKYVDIVTEEGINPVTLVKGQYWFNTYRFDGREITVNVWDDEARQSIYMQKKFKLDIANAETFKEKGIIKLL